MGYVFLTTFSNYIEANIALSMLEEQGINCHIEDENSVTTMGMSSGIRLMVYESQARRAAEIIKNTETEFLKTVACPVCHHSGFEIKYVMENHEDVVRKIPLGRIIALLSRVLSKEGMNMPVKHYVCLNCRTELKDLPS